MTSTSEDICLLLGDLDMSPNFKFIIVIDFSVCVLPVPTYDLETIALTKKSRNRLSHSTFHGVENVGNFVT